MRKSLLLFTLLLFISAVFGLTAMSFIPHGYKMEEEVIVVNEPVEIPEPVAIPAERIVPIEAKAKLIAVGDIMFHMPQINAAKTDMGGYDFNPVFEHVKKYIESADLAIGNFETVTLGNEYGFSGFPRFNSPIETISALKNTGFDILVTANNHSLDKNKEGIINTINEINKQGLINIGTFKDNTRPLVIEEINDIKIGFISYTSSLNGLDSLLSTEDSYMVNKFNENNMIEDINALKKEGVDVIIAYLHWGFEYYREPTEAQVEFGRKLLEWGVDIILGSHPHVIQKSELLNIDGRDKLIVYSMGNFLSNQRYETMGNSYTEDGVMVEITLSKNSFDDTMRIENVTYIPTWVHRYRNQNKLKYEILPIEEILSNLENYNLSNDTIVRMEKSYNDTINKISFDLEIQVAE
jgi:poly-gamma-glutamate synthesis protein (capsule biosynthesis protein)